MRRQGWLRPNLSPLPFKALQQRRLLAAHIGSRANPQLDIEVRPKQPLSPRYLQSRSKGTIGQRIFAARIDVALAGPHREGGDGHAFNKAQGIAFHQHPVGKRAAVALVGIADNEFPRARRRRDCLPLDPCRETRAATPAQARGCHLGNHLLAPDGTRPLQAFHATAHDKISMGERIDHTATRKQKACLQLQARQRLNRSEKQRMGPTLQDPGIDISNLERSIPQPHTAPLHLDKWLEPVQPARSRACYLQGQAGLCGNRTKRRQHPLDATGHRHAVSRDEDADHASPSARLITSCADTRA